MLNKKHNSHSAFTLIEVLIVLAVLAVIFWFSQSIDINEINKGKNAELFTSKIARVFENTRNNSLLWEQIVEHS